jgi:hypothetical protein
MSARFPVISPHGNLRDSRGEVVDRIVDGGYFENDGLATAADIAEALKNAEELRAHDIKPVIILITNEPEPEDNGSGPPLRPNQSDLRLPPHESSTLFETFTVIGRALYDTRSGHEAGDTEYAKSVVGSENLFHVAVRDLKSPDGALCRTRASYRTGNASMTAAMRDLSVSWWMSQPAQAFLDDQLCDESNNKEIAKALHASTPKTGPAK